MNMRKTATMIFRITIKMVMLSAVVALFYIVCSKTFQYGADIFSEEAMAAAGEGYDVVVTIPEDTSAGELGDILVENELIEDASIFRIQALLYELEITPGTYRFSTEDNVEDIIDIINAVDTLSLDENETKEDGE